MSTATQTRTRLRPVNGKVLRLDGRSHQARRRAALITKFTNACGGPNHLDPGQAELIERLAILTIRAETMERQVMRNDPAYSDDIYLRMVGAIRRLTDDLGLDRPRRPTVPDEGDYDDADDDGETLEQFLVRSKPPPRGGARGNPALAKKKAKKKSKSKSRPYMGAGIRD